MQNISLTEDVKEIINKLRIVAADSEACEIYRNSIGWQYGGYKIEAQLNHLKGELEKKKKKKSNNCKVVEIKMVRFLRNANVVNPTNNLILIPVNGDALFGNTTVIPDEGYYTDEDQRPLYGCGVDVIIVVLSRK
ncbi:uncharacterized protein EURHEDRAFT_122558 [Aspergillus ruber CBS 135680]|uniref:Uncharacterized protein n=1 Tax=Aspergillus ruber (strain CBS 135680) TaxID=1388766 RepID=A0A017SQZ8_ASPRC|nr:uncharacterized protein EURHEDRAFT_122558 [Aspergillus ruber CBS 135680]EYE98994.1 hypothetical protein EURHEDRAFT_122558 [Aspergillus ruber CBS 135680]